ncbi:ribonuclease H-like domain-containing protein [Tanacetum coccineum]
MVTWYRVGSNKPTKKFTFHVTPISPLPKSYRDAFNDPNWQNAVHDEYNALIKNKTWTLVPHPHDANIIRSMWLFRHKFLADGTLSRYKARLVANGSTQMSGVDVDETFSPVVKPGTIRTVLSLAVSRHWPVHQLDVKNAFLHGDLSETVYMYQPPGFRDPVHPDYVCLLQRSLYGLKQAPRAWFQRFAAYVTRYVPLTEWYDMEILEMGLIRLQCNPSRTPVNTDSKLVCLYMHDPREPHFSALKRILRYIRGTIDHGLQLFSASTTSLVAYSDADWAGCPTTRRSTSGYCVFLGNNLLSWSSKRQHTLSRSSAEAEYRGVCNVFNVAETCWFT